MQLSQVSNLFSIIMVPYYLTLVLHFSHVSIYFATRLDAAYKSLIVPIHVSTLIGDSLLVDQVYRYLFGA